MVVIGRRKGVARRREAKNCWARWLEAGGAHVEKKSHKCNNDTESGNGTSGSGKASTMDPEAWSQKGAPSIHVD